MSSGPAVSGTKGRALELLSQNVPSSQVAQILGVTESQISQLMADEDFAALVTERRVAASQEDERFDSKLETGEESALDNILSRVKFGNLDQSLKIFRTLNQAKRRKDSRVATPSGSGQVTNLILPAVLIPVYVKNEKSEIIEVDGKTMLSASNTRLNEIVKEKTGVEMALSETKALSAAQTLENVTRSLVRPMKRQTRQISAGKQDLVDLI